MARLKSRFPLAFLRPFIEDYITLSSIHEVVRNAYARRVYVNRAFQKKTNDLIQRHIGTQMVAEPLAEYATIVVEHAQLAHHARD